LEDSWSELLSDSRYSLSVYFLGEPGFCVKEDINISYPKDNPRGALHPCQPSAPEEDAWKGRELMG